MKIFRAFVLIMTALCCCPCNSKGISLCSLSPEDTLKIIEKAYLHVDRDTYLPGEDIWFKAYLVDAADRLLSNHSGNLHVELISPDLKIINSHIIKLNNGLGNGDFNLSGKLQSGRYHLRAYTNYMRNFGDQSFFNKEITIINPSDSINTFSKSTGYIRDKLEISFFPEGGTLVDNVPSIVAFKAVNAVVDGCDVSGEIYSSQGEIVSVFKSTHKGMGIFSLTPIPGISYYAVVTNVHADSDKYEIPKSYPTGVVLSVSKNRDDELSLIFKTNSATLPLILNGDLSLSLSSHNITYERYNFRMNSLNSYLTIPVDALHDGILILTLTGTDNMPLCERLVFIPDYEEIKVNVEPDKKVYRQRDSVTVKISLRVNSRRPQDAFLSLSAVKNITEDNTSRYPSTISSWFLLESDVRGPVEEPSYYFDLSNPERLKDLDVLLLTQGWRDFAWKYKDLNYPPEHGFNISGRVRKKFADAPFKNSDVNISIFKSGNPVIRTVPTDSSGRFYLDGVDLTGDAKLIVSATGKNDKLKGLLLLDSLRYSPAIVIDSIAQRKYIQNNDKVMSNDLLTGESQLISKSYHTFIQYAEINNSIQRKYKLSDTIKPGEVTISAKRKDWTETARSRSRHYLKATPDREFKITPQLEAYTNVGQLVTSRIISPFRLKGEVSTWGLNPGITNPLYLLDGTIVPKEDVTGLPLSWVERIDVLDKPSSFYATFGPMAAPGDTSKHGNPIDGVISIILKNDFPDTYYPVAHSVNIKFSGYDEPRIFYSPKHYTKLENDYKPDLRTTLFWEPYIKVENNKEIFLNYYNGDNPSKVKVVVEGISTSGIPLTGKAEYEVK